MKKFILNIAMVSIAATPVGIISCSNDKVIPERANENRDVIESTHINIPETRVIRCVYNNFKFKKSSDVEPMPERVWQGNYFEVTPETFESILNKPEIAKQTRDDHGKGYNVSADHSYHLSTTNQTKFVGSPKWLPGRVVEIYDTSYESIEGISPYYPGRTEKMYDPRGYGERWK